MRVAIIGATGQLGSDLVEIFGEEAIPIDHNMIDIEDSSTVKILENLAPDVVINTAAYTRVDDAEVEVYKAFGVNAIGALNVAKTCNTMKAVNVYVSTDYVFDGNQKVPYTEHQMPNPVNVYGASKYAGEIFTRNYSSSYYIIRVASLYGRRGSRGKKGNFVDVMIQKAQRGESIQVVNDMYMSPTYTKDVAIMLKRFLEIMPEYGIYHMVNTGYCSWYELTQEIFRILNENVKITPISTNMLQRLAKRPLFSALENQKLEKLGLYMKSWREALSDYLHEKYAKL